MRILPLSSLALLPACGASSIPNDNSFVLLELFTSQSCSSCPPADTDLNAVAARQREKGTREFIVAWHVDYWNNLGWVDPYSSAEASDRQFAYVDAINTRRYTPQAVANGREDFIAGSDDERYTSIQHWLGEPSPVSLELFPERLGDDRLIVGIEMSGAPEGTELLVVLLQSGIVTDVSSGENAGKTLSHDNVVRSTARESIDATEVVLDIPDTIPDEELSVVAMVQEMDTLAVVGAQLAEVAALP